MPKGIHFKYSNEMVKFFVDHGEKDIDKNLVVEFNEKFNTNITRRMYSAKRYRLGIKSKAGDGRIKKGNIPYNKGQKMSAEQYEKCKRTMYKKGNVPPQIKPIGYIRVNRDGYQEIKTEDGFKLLQRVKYEEYHNVKLKTSDRIIFLDSDRFNLSKENLKLVNGNQLARLNQAHLITDNAEITQLGIDIVDLKITMKGRKKKCDKHEKKLKK